MPRKKKPQDPEQNPSYEDGHGENHVASDLLDASEAAPVTGKAVLMSKSAPWPITEELRLSYGDESADITLQIEAMERDKREENNKRREAINEKKDRRKYLSEVLDSGVETREGDVLVEYDPEHGEVRTYDPETKVCLERRNMTAEEHLEPPML
jgi:hypothetical protein